MATSYPSGLDNFSNPTSTSKLGDSGVVHHEQHANSNDAIEAIQAKLGANNSSVVTSIDYRVRYLENNPTLPSQSGNIGKYLTTDGSSASWATIDISGKQDKVSGVSDTEIGYLDGVTSLIQTQLNAKAVYPSISGQGGKFLTTDGSTVSWATVSGGGSSISSTDQLPEGTSNLYFTNERAQDAIDTLFANGNHNGITVTYNDQNNSISLASTSSALAATPTSLGTVYGWTPGGSGTSTYLGNYAGPGVGGTYGVTAIGASTLMSNTGNYNTALGSGALNSNTTGSDNTAIGSQSLPFNTTGFENVAVGRLAGYSNTTGAANIAIGNDSLKLNTVSQQNVAIGKSSLQEFVSTEAQGLNTAIGNESGKGITTGIKNTLIGAFAGKNYVAQDLTTGSNNILIGHAASASSATVSNEITLGNSQITRFRVPGLGIDWTSSTVPGGLPTITTKTTNYEILSTDMESLILVDSASQITITLPLNSSQNISNGKSINITQYGNASVKIVGASGVTVLSNASTPAQPTSRIKYSGIIATKIATDTWLIQGDIA
jgi:hypothetical protein